MDLTNRIAIITGASRGIGAQIAEAFAKAGATIVVASTKDETAQKKAKDLEEKYGNPSLGIGVDVANKESCDALVAKTLETFGSVDILINNAGITQDNLLLRLSEEDMASVIQTNLLSVMYLSKAVLRPMLKKRAGRIICMSSVVGLIGNPGQSNYAASKAGIHGFTKSLAKEIGAKGITCNAIAPGFIETDMTDALPKEHLDNIIASIPLRRLGNTKDVANLALFLASDAAAYITGQVIAVDGGIQM